MEVRIRLRAFDSICLRDAHRAFLIQRRNPLLRKDFQKSWIGFPIRRRLFSLLRSPHVHKKAQDQFYFKEYHSVCTLSHVTREDIITCFSLTGISSTLHFMPSTPFPKEENSV